MSISSPFYAGPARSARELAAARRLAASIFPAASQQGMDESLRHKEALWDDPEGLAPENVIVVADQPDRPLGLIRLVYRTLRRGEERWPCAGITSVGVAAECRGRGLSQPLMQAALEAARRHGAVVALLFARRATDDYYTQFGFHGLSSYPRLSLPLARLADVQVDVEPLPSQSWEQCEAWRRAAYADCFGWCERAQPHWRLIFDKIGFGHLAGLRLSQAGQPCGYALTNGSRVVEIALAPDAPAAACLRAIGQRLGVDVLAVDIGSDHRLLDCLAPHDLTLSTRQCPYGGHMLAALDTDWLLAARSARAARGSAGCAPRRERVGGLSLDWDGHKASGTLSGLVDHATLAALLAVRQPTLPASRLDPPAELFIPAPDEF